MIARLATLRKQPVVFQHLTGLAVAVFDALAAQVVPAVEAAHRKKLARPDRQRAIGGGDDFDLSTADQVLLTVVWLRQYPTNEVLGFLFGVSDSTASRARTRQTRGSPRLTPGTRAISVSGGTYTRGSK